MRFLLRCCSRLAACSRRQGYGRTVGSCSTLAGHALIDAGGDGDQPLTSRALMPLIFSESTLWLVISPRTGCCGVLARAFVRPTETSESSAPGTATTYIIHGTHTSAAAGLERWHQNIGQNCDAADGRRHAEMRDGSRHRGGPASYGQESACLCGHATPDPT